MLLKLLWMLTIQLLLLYMMLHRPLLIKIMILCTKVGNLIRSHRVGISKLLSEIQLMLLLQPVRSMCRRHRIL